MYSAKYNKVNNRNSLVVNYPEIARTWDFKKMVQKSPTTILMQATRKFGGNVKKITLVGKQQ